MYFALPTLPCGHNPRPRRFPRGNITVWDSVDSGAIPSNVFAAVYATGAYYAKPAQTTRFRNTTWIDVDGSDPGAQALDIEQGDATPDTVLTWVPEHCKVYGKRAVSRLYCNFSNWGAVKAAVAKLASEHRDSVRYWIANPTGHAHIVPGADATQYYWGARYDLTLARPSFF